MEGGNKLEDKERGQRLAKKWQLWKLGDEYMRRHYTILPDFMYKFSRQNDYNATLHMGSTQRN